jgi:hypothetical protein
LGRTSLRTSQSLKLSPNEQKQPIGPSHLGVPPAAIAERVIGHELPELIAVYDVHAYEAEKRAALNKWTGELRRILKIFPRVERECSL